MPRTASSDAPFHGDPGTAASDAPPPGADLAAYVASAARLLRLPLDAAQAGRVATQLTRTLAFATLLQDLPLQPDDEAPEIFCPAPFPAYDVAHEPS